MGSIGGVEAVGGERGEGARSKGKPRNSSLRKCTSSPIQRLKMFLQLLRHFLICNLILISYLVH